MFGPVSGATANTALSVAVTGLTPVTAYRWVLCGSPNDGATYRCVGPKGTISTPTADPPPDYETFTTTAGWSVQSTPAPPGAFNTYLNAVSCTSASACTAVGYYQAPDRPVAERWDGRTWTIQPTPIPSNADDGTILEGVSCASASACTAVGHYTDYNNGYPFTAALVERWDGTSWTIQPTPTTGPTERLRAVSCMSAASCTAVGYTYRAGDQVTLAEGWNGTTWTIEPTPNGSFAGESDLNAVSCSSPSACTATGNSGTALAQRWNGSTWTSQLTTVPPGKENTAFFGVSCPSATACVAAGFTGGTRELAEGWDGTSWTVQPTVDTPNGSQFEGVSCATATACTAVGVYNDATGLKDLTLAERWNGTTWTIQSPLNPGPVFYQNDYNGNPEAGQSNNLVAVSCPTATFCVAVGNYHDSNGRPQSLAEQYRQ